MSLYFSNTSVLCFFAPKPFLRESDAVWCRKAGRESPEKLNHVCPRVVMSGRLSTLVDGRMAGSPVKLFGRAK